MQYPFGEKACSSQFNPLLQRLGCWSQKGYTRTKFVLFGRNVSQRYHQEKMLVATACDYLEEAEIKPSESDPARGPAVNAIGALTSYLRGHLESRTVIFFPDRHLLST